MLKARRLLFQRGVSDQPFQWPGGLELATPGIWPYY